MGAAGIVKDELLYTNRDWPLNSWALLPITVPGMREAFANCLMNKSLNKSFQCLWRVVQLKHQRSSEEEEIPAGWETHRILHGEGWLMESWKEEKMEIELSRWWFQQNQCHRGRKNGGQVHRTHYDSSSSLILPIYLGWLMSLPSVSPELIYPTHFCWPYLSKAQLYNDGTALVRSICRFPPSAQRSSSPQAST